MTPSAHRETWLRRFHPATGSAVRLVCFPHAGGSASFFHPVSARLSPAIEVLGVQYPGRQDRRAEPNIDAIPGLADAIHAVLRGFADRPLAFFGHSMGAVLAYEVGLRLRRDGVTLARLYASGRRAPSRYRPETVHEQGDERLIAEVRQLSGMDAGLLDDPETLEMIMPALRSDYRAIETYRHTPGQLLTCPVVALVGDADPRVDLDEARAWADHTTGPFDLRIFPGDHFYLVGQSAQVIALIRDDLAAVELARR
jgi:surfactin synthase thioesterase subunit